MSEINLVQYVNFQYIVFMICFCRVVIEYSPLSSVQWVINHKKWMVLLIATIAAVPFALYYKKNNADWFNQFINLFVSYTVGTTMYEMFMKALFEVIEQKIKAMLTALSAPVVTSNPVPPAMPPQVPGAPVQPLPPAQQQAVVQPQTFDPPVKGN